MKARRPWHPSYGAVFFDLRHVNRLHSTMFFPLLIYSLTSSNLGDASPIPLIERRAETSCNDLNNCRTLRSIILSCLSTIFLCTWVSLHPNVAIAPDTAGSWDLIRRFVRNKLPLLLCGLLVPEYTLAWAFRQYLKAGAVKEEISKERPDREWSRAHGFFVIMGGFHRYGLSDGAALIAYPPELSMPPEFALPPLNHSRDKELPERSLGFKDFTPAALAYLAPTEAEIKDRGKADVLTKVITLVQTAWFITQCIGRGVEHLPLTELEVVTLAYAVVNLFTYLFWWHKPKDVECPIRVYKTTKVVQVTSEGKKEWDSGVVGGLARIIIYVVGAQDENSSQSKCPCFGRARRPNQTCQLSCAQCLARPFLESRLGPFMLSHGILNSHLPSNFISGGSRA